jgi:hypothetical protein
MKDILGVICVVGNITVSILVLLAAKFGGEWAQKMMDTMVPMVVQSWMLNFAVIINHKYGSSQGSADKDVMIEEVLKRLTAPKIAP